MPSLPRRHLRNLVMAACTAWCLAARAPAQTGTLNYEPSLGTLPTDQGWDFVEIGVQPAPTIVGGTLHVGPTQFEGRQYWTRDVQVPVSFADGAFIEADVDIVSSSYTTNLCGTVAGQRAGFYIGITDSLGRIAWAGIGSTTVFLTSADATPVIPIYPSTSFNASGRHTFRIQTDATHAVLLIDGNPVLTMPHGIPDTSTPNTPLFGDVSVCATHTVVLHHLSTTGPLLCDPIDFNNDGLFPDTSDIDDFLSVFSGGVCSNDPDCGDIDYNNDGLFPDTLDIEALLSVFSGGACL